MNVAEAAALIAAVFWALLVSVGVFVLFRLGRLNREANAFEDMVASGQLLEWAKFAGNFYGTPRGPVAERLTRGLPGLLEVDVVGARQVRAAVPDALLVFLAPPSWDELVRRLTGRETEPADAIEQRLEAARAELRAESEFDVTLVNTSVRDVCTQLVALMTAKPADQTAK